MLSLAVRSGDYITIGPDIVIKFFKAGEVFSVAIDAPKELRISRSKLYEQENETPPCIQRLQSVGEPASHKNFKRKR